MKKTIMDWWTGKYVKGCYSFLSPDLLSHEETTERLVAILDKQNGLKQAQKQLAALRKVLRKEREK